MGLASASAITWLLFQLLVAPHVVLEALVDGSLRAKEDAVLVALQAILFIFAFGLSLLGIHWQRTRSVPVFSAFSAAHDRKIQKSDMSGSDFSSALDARDITPNLLRMARNMLDYRKMKRRWELHGILDVPGSKRHNGFVCLYRYPLLTSKE